MILNPVLVSKNLRTKSRQSVESSTTRTCTNSILILCSLVEEWPIGLRVPSLRFHESAKPSLRSDIKELALEQSTGPVCSAIYVPVEVEKHTRSVGTRSGFDRQERRNSFRRNYYRVHLYRSRVFRQKREDPFSRWTRHQASFFCDSLDCWSGWQVT